MKDALIRALHHRRSYINRRERPKRVLRFSYGGRAGKVSIHYRKNDAPREVEWKIPNLDLNATLGFPLIYAKVDYDGTGYDRMFGWTQLITTQKLRTGKKEIVFDPYPSTSDLNLPFAPFGFLPEMFDVPITDDPEQRTNFKWVADTFLTNFPTRRNRPICPILGFQWGYVFHNDSFMPSLLPLKTIGSKVWNSHLRLLRRKFKGWKFARADKIR